MQITEQPSLYDHLEKKSVREILEDINREDQKVASAVQKAIPQIEHLVNLIVPRMRQGGRIFYMGAGTSGRLGVLDASEVPPTFGMSPNWIIGLIAGGDTALRNPVEGAEDDTNRGWEELTEQPSLYDHLEKKSVREILEDINREDQKVASAVQKAIPQIEHLVNLIVPRMRQGGRIFYMGAGTSGRLGVLDASEVPPTFGMSPNWIIGLIAGGDTALRNPVEGAEDDTNRGWEELTEHHINNKDTVIGIAASGTTPYVIGALHEARKQGILTGCITSNPDSPMAAEADVAIEMIVGPEYVTGSSRMKSGTGQKMILNMISTSVMIQLGRVKGNKMVNMQLSNQKLVERGTRMIMEELGLDHDHAQKLLLLHGSVKKVIDANSQSFHRNTKSN